MSNTRVDKLRQKMQQMSVDAFLVTAPFNIYYLSGFTGDDGLLLVTENDKYLITDARFSEQVAHQNPDWQAVITRNYLQSACELAKQKNISAMAFENTISYAQYDLLDELAQCDIVPLAGILEEIRAIKDEQEIEIIKKSCELAGQGYRYVLDMIAAGQTEMYVANELDHFMKLHGAQDKSFETILASGEHTTWPHGTASSKIIETGDLVTLDFGYYLDHYTSDVTRTFSVGKQSDEVKKVYDTVLTAQIKTIEAIKPGITSKELDDIGRDYIKAQGYGQYFEHGMGHGIGLDIHELPNISYRSQEVLQPGQIITIEPGIYVPGVGGVRIEDDILVTKDGYENLTQFTKEYLEILN